MKSFKLSSIILSAIVVSSLGVYAGNNDRAGEAGASQMLINPWTKSVGFGGANTASVIGLESMQLNIAGLAFVRKTELMFTYKNWLAGSGVDVNSFGFAQKIGESSAIAMSVMSMSFGDIDITTVDMPEGGIGTFSPSYLNLDFGYSKMFSDNISAGLGVRIISEGISNISSRGFAFDAGIRYVTGENDQMKFGIALNNVGPTMQAAGDGIAFSNNMEVAGIDVQSSQNHRVASYQLPSLLNIGVSYDFYINPNLDSSGILVKSLHRLTVAGNFTANSFTNDIYKIGLEYSYKELFMVRGGYNLESDTWFDSEKRATAYTGPAFGASFLVPLGKKGATFSIDYAYQLTERFDGTHSMGVKLNL